MLNRNSLKPQICPRTKSQNKPVLLHWIYFFWFSPNIFPPHKKICHMEQGMGMLRGCEINSFFSTDTIKQSKKQRVCLFQQKMTSSFVNTKMRIENSKNLFILNQGYFLQRDSRNTSSQIIKSTPGITKTQTIRLHSCLQNSMFG